MYVLKKPHVFIFHFLQSTEKDLSNENEDFLGASNVSFTEFLQQYMELTDWLNQVHKVTQREVTCYQSEKYLNQVSLLLQ